MVVNTNLYMQQNRRVLWRFFKNSFVRIFSYITTFIMVWVLCSILVTLMINGFPGITFFTFTHVTASQSKVGGLLNPILGSIIQVGLAACISIPVGISAGIFLAEFNYKKINAIVRFFSDILISVPSILVGLLVYLILVVSIGYSAIAGACSLAILAIPIIARTSEEALAIVPFSIREAGFALGAPKWKVILWICLPAARGGVMTGILLAISRIAGETAPLLFTSLGNSNWSWNIFKPMSSLPLIIYQYADSADDALIKLAWTAALLVTIFVLCLNLIARVYMKRCQRKGRHI